VAESKLIFFSFSYHFWWLNLLACLGIILYCGFFVLFFSRFFLSLLMQLEPFILVFGIPCAESSRISIINLF